MTNDLFRMVSLRHSKKSQRDGAPPSAPDPRLRYRPLLDGQATTGLSPHEATLQKLKGRHVELSKKEAQLERVQVALMNSYMSWAKQRPVPNPSSPSLRTTRRPAASRRASSSLIPIGEAGSTLIADRAGFIERVEARLNRPDGDLFRDILGTASGD